MRCAMLLLAPSRFSSRAVIVAAFLSSVSVRIRTSYALHRLSVSQPPAIASSQIVLHKLQCLISVTVSSSCIPQSRHLDTFAQMNDMYTSPLTHAPTHVPHQYDAISSAMHPGSLSLRLHCVTIILLVFSADACSWPTCVWSISYTALCG
jgi:hypothetical protein